MVWLRNHAIKHVSVCGLVVSVHPKHPVPGPGGDTKLVLQLDDTCGLVECVRWWSDLRAEQQRKELAVLRLGVTLRVQGTLRTYRGQRQVDVKAFWPEHDLHAETLHWLRVRWLYETCYQHSFRIPTWAREEARSAEEAPTTPSRELCSAVLDVVAQAGEPISARSIVAKSSVKALLGHGRAVDAVVAALSKLEEGSSVYQASGQLRGERFWVCVT